MPVLRTADGIEYDKTRIVLYAYRHTYAQRHADAGVAVDVLRELMDPPQARHHQAATTGSAKPAAARPSTGSPRCSSTGTATGSGGRPKRCWTPNTPAAPSAKWSSRSASAPNRPTSKPAAHACPYRFRCAGCDHFRTDVSYLPDLHAYLDDLLRNRERLLASTDHRRLGTRRGHAIDRGDHPHPPADRPHHHRPGRTHPERATHRSNKPSPRPPPPQRHARHAPHPPNPARPAPGEHTP